MEQVCFQFMFKGFKIKRMSLNRMLKNACVSGAWVGSVCVWEMSVCSCLLMRYCCQLAQDTSSTPDEIETRRQLRKKALNGKRSSVLAVAPSSSSTSIHSQRSVSMMMSDTLLNPNKFNKKANLQRLSRISEESSSLSTISKRPSNVGSVGAGSVRPHTVQDFRGRDRKLETIADTDDVELRRTSSIQQVHWGGERWWGLRYPQNSR